MVCSDLQTYSVCVQGLEQIDHELEVVCSFLTSRVRRIARWLKCGYTCPVSRPFVLPESLTRLAVAQPVVLHV